MACSALNAITVLHFLLWGSRVIMEDGAGNHKNQRQWMSARMSIYLTWQHQCTCELTHRSWDYMHRTHMRSSQQNPIIDLGGGSWSLSSTKELLTTAAGCWGRRSQFPLGIRPLRVCPSSTTWSYTQARPSSVKWTQCISSTFYKSTKNLEEKVTGNRKAIVGEWMEDRFNQNI